MPIFAGKSIYCTVLKPWASRKIIVRCCSNLGESSSINFPVRYIPKKLSNSNNNNNKPNDFKNPESLRKPNSPNVMFRKVKEKLPADNGFKSGSFRSKETEIRNSVMRSEVKEYDYIRRSKPKEELHEFDAMEDHEEPIDDELDFENGNHEINHLVVGSSKSKKEAEMVAVGLLAKRAYTALELKKKLLGKKFSNEVSNAVISDFQNRGLINDLLYAEAFSRSRWSSSSWGPLKIKQALTKKGVNDFDAQKAIKLVLQNDEPGDDDEVSTLGLSKPSMDHLFAQASKQWLRAKDLPIEKQKSRIITWLRYRGFNWGIISFLLKKLQSEHPSYDG